MKKITRDTLLAIVTIVFESLCLSEGIIMGIIIWTYASVTTIQSIVVLLWYIGISWYLYHLIPITCNALEQIELNTTGVFILRNRKYLRHLNWCDVKEIGIKQPLETVGRRGLSTILYVSDHKLSDFQRMTLGSKIGKNMLKSDVIFFNCADRKINGYSLDREIISQIPDLSNDMRQLATLIQKYPCVAIEKSVKTNLYTEEQYRELTLKVETANERFAGGLFFLLLFVTLGIILWIY